MPVSQILLVAAAVWIVVALVARFVVVPWLASAPSGDPLVGFLWRVTRVYCRLVHRVQYSGLEHIPTPEKASSGLIVIANHTGAADPLLIQAACRFHVRWMMAADMMGPDLDWLWRVQPIIPVARDGTDSGPLREAIRQARSGSVVGIFPEGRITTPPRELRPFLPGVGLLVLKSRAPVLLAWISGTPDTNNFHASLATRSNARVRFLDLIEFDPDQKDVAAIAENLRLRIASASGWALNDEVLVPGGRGPGD